MKQQESAVATTAATGPPVAAVAGYTRSSSLTSSGNKAKMTLEQIQRQAGSRRSGRVERLIG